MKKKVLLFITLFTMVFMTGCGTKKEELKPIDVLEKTIQNLADIKSLEVVSSINAKLNQDGTKVDMNIPLTIAASEAKDEMGLKISLGENPFIGTLEAYLVANTKDKKLDLYFPSSIYDMMFGIESKEPKWLYTNVDLEEDSEMTIKDEDLEKIKNIDYKKVIGDNFVYVDSNEGINHYQLIFNGDLINRLAVEIGEETENYDEEKEIKLDVYIDAKNYNITKISSDLKELVLENSTDEEDLEVFN